MKIDELLLRDDEKEKSFNDDAKISRYFSLRLPATIYLSITSDKQQILQPLVPHSRRATI